MGPDLSSGVGTSAGKSRVYLPYVCVCCLNRPMEPLGLIQSFLFSASSSPDIYPARRCRMSR